MVVCLSVSTAGANFSLAGFILFALLSGKFWAERYRVLRNPIVLSSLVLFAVMALSVLWSGASADVAWQWVSKYKKLLLIPLALPFFYVLEHKQLFFKGLFASLLAGLAVSYLNFFGLTSVGDCPSAGCSTHSYITLSILNCLLLSQLICFFI